MQHDLRLFIALLQEESELSTVSVEVDTKLEIAAVTDRICKQPDGGKALLFLRPKGYDFAVATNLFGSYKRSSLALGIKNMGQLTDKMTDLLHLVYPFNLQNIDTQISNLAEFNKFKPFHSKPLWEKDKTVSTLYDFPFLQNWNGDGSNSGNPRYITLGEIFTANPDSSTQNCGIYRAQVIGANQLAIHWGKNSGAACHLTLHEKLNKNMPVAITLGGDPSLIFSAMMPLPGNLDEVTFAGFLQNLPLNVSPCHTTPLYVPSTAEVLLEGFVVPGESFNEGPFGNYTGHYAPTGPAPVMHITSISIRPDAIIPSTIVGVPPMEDSWMANAWERILLPFLQKIHPEIINIHIPIQWSFHKSAIISLESPLPGMVREISSNLWKLSWFANSKILIFVSSEIPVEQSGTVSWKAINEFNPRHDMIINADNNRIAVDATGCRLQKPSIQRGGDIDSLISNRWSEYGLA